MSDIKQVIVMRKDLHMRAGKMIAQGAHASIKFLTDKIQNTKSSLHWIQWTEEERAWIYGSFTKIVVSVDSEEELMKIYDYARLANLTVSLIVDSGATEFHGVPTSTCIAIGPNKSEDIDKVTGHLKLL